MSINIKQIIQEEVQDFVKNLDAYLKSKEADLTDEVNYLTKMYNALPSDLSDERRAKSTQKNQVAAELKTLQKISREFEEAKKVLNSAGTTSTTTPGETTTTTTITGSVGGQ